MTDRLPNAIEYAFTSPNESDRNGEVANVVDALFYIGRALHRIADCMEGQQAASRVPHDQAA